MVKLKVWHTTEHDNYTVSSIELAPNLNANEWVNTTRTCGGVWIGGGFVPWHKINYVEVGIGQ